MSKKLTRTQASALAAKLVRESGGCPICQRSWATILAEYEAKVQSKGIKRRQVPYVLDHDHKTGLCRGVLCRGCNGAEGRITNIAATWGKQGHDGARVISWLKRLVRYLDSPSLPYVYPTHMSEEEKAKKKSSPRVEAARKKAAARRKALAQRGK